MALKIRYSLRASDERIKLLEDIIDRFGIEKAREINDKMDRVVSQISIMPEMYRVSKKRRNLKKCVFSKQTSIYYRVKGDYLEIISFRSNQIDPKSFEL